MCKVIVAGSRTVRDYTLVATAIECCPFPVTELVTGKQRSWDREKKCWYGVDYFGEQWARKNNIPITAFPAQWDKYGKPAGPIRNKQMAEYAEALIAIWDGVSSSTKNMIEEMELLKKVTYTHFLG